MRAAGVLILFVLVVGSTLAKDDKDKKKPVEDGRAGINPIVEIVETEKPNRKSRSILDRFFTPSYYSCDFLPKVAFFPDNGGPIPAYKCVRGSSEVLLATRSFHSALSLNEFAAKTTVELDDNVLNTLYPGNFRQIPNVLFNGVRGVEGVGSPVAVNGLLVISSSNRRSRSMFDYSDTFQCQFLPYVNFFAGEYGQLPTYRCVRGRTEILIASDSFRSARNPYEYIDYVDISLDDSVLNTFYPGSFMQVMNNQYRSLKGLKFEGSSVAINGLLLLNQ